MQKKIEKSGSDNLRYKLVKDMLSNLGLSIDDEKAVAELSKIEITIMIMVSQYCKNHTIDSGKTYYAIKEYASNEVPLAPQPDEDDPDDILLTWPGKIIAEYVQQTMESQWFAIRRVGGVKSLRSILLTTLLIELHKTEGINNKLKISIAQAFLNNMLSDRIWESGEKGKKAINLCLENFKHAEYLMGIENRDTELRLLRAVSEIISKVSSYRPHVNQQYCMGAISHYFKRQGTTNLECFDDFLLDINRIVKTTASTPSERIKMMISKLNEVRPSMRGDVSNRTWQEIFNLLSDIKTQLEKKEDVAGIDKLSAPKL